MDLSRTLVLGLIAGSTIVLGLPVARLRRPPSGLRQLLNATAIGILLFLVWDVFSAAWEPIDTALSNFHSTGASVAPAVRFGVVFAAGLSVGLLAMVAYERYLNSRRTATATASFGPGAVASAELRRPGLTATWSAAQRMSLLIAVGIGLHNFAEGLAIGQSAASGDIALAALLVIGFGLHNATEGFGIVAPLAAAPLAAAERGTGRDERPSWRFLLAMAAIGGGPTFVGTWIGHSFTSAYLSVAFLTLAAGSIIYVVAQLFGVAAKAKRTDLLAAGLLIGLFAGFLTDAIVSAGGA